MAYAIASGCDFIPSAEGYTQAREAVARAIALEPELPEAHAVLATIQMVYDWDWQGAAESLNKALALAPGNARFVSSFGALALRLGRYDEAIGLYRRLIEQDPLSAISYAGLGAALSAAGAFAEAELARRKAREFDPSITGTHSSLAINLLALGRGEEALAEVAQESVEGWRLYVSAIILHAVGRPAEADAVLHELIAKYADNGAVQIAEVYAARDEADAAFDWLERAYSQRDTGLCDMKKSLALRGLHGDPRWGVFLSKMALPS